MTGAARCWAAVPAAGSGSRFAASVPKQYLRILDKTVLEHALAPLIGHPEIRGTAVALAPDDRLFGELPESTRQQVIVVEGGSERCHSVLNCLRALLARADAADWVLVHDAARPCLRRGDIDRLITEVRAAGTGGVLAVPVRDTMKRANGSRCIEETVDRRELWHALTPQMFPLAGLEEALAACVREGRTVTDEAQAMEYRGVHPLLVPGSRYNIKITHQDDLALAECFLARREAGA